MSEQPLQRAAIYGRYSSHNQKDTSIEQQFLEIRQYCKQNGIHIVAEYADRAMSGTTDQRPQFQQMIRDSAKGKFNLLVCWKVDRFARDRYASATYKYRLKKNGVRVLYAKESIPDGPEGILLESILEGSAEYYSAALAQNIRRGLEANARECKVTGSIPLGYAKAPDGKYAIDPVEADVVRKIFTLYTSGTSAKEICDTLNAQGHKTKKGALFNKNSLRTILTNERYTGTFIYGDIKTPGGIPAIISQDVYQKAIAMCKFHSEKPAASYDAPYLLTGKLFCGHCGEPMIGMSGHGKSGAKHTYYACATKRRGDKSCDKKNVRRESIESAVVDLTCKYVFQPEIMEAIANAAVKLQEAERDTGILDGLQAKLRETETSLRNIMRAIEQGIFNNTTAARMNQLESEKNDLLNLIEDAKIERPFYSKEQVLFILDEMRKGDPLSPAFRERIIDIFVTAVYLYDDNRIKIIYTYNNQIDDTYIPSDFREEKENEAESLSESGKCSTSRVVVEAHTQNANTHLYLTAKYIVLCTLLTTV